MRADELLDDLYDLLDDLRMENLNMPVIVEGEKDISSLRELGLKGEIIGLHGGLSLFNFCEAVSRKHKRVIVLTDWDRRGGTLCRRLQEGFDANGVRSDLGFRRNLAIMCRKDVKDVQSLPSYIMTLKERTKEMRNQGAVKRTTASLNRARASRERKKR